MTSGLPAPEPFPSPAPSTVPSAGAGGAGSSSPPTLADYELLGEIERGGMGIVYQAREKASGRLVALKMMLGEADAGSTDRQRFVLEARATGELNHPGIVAIHAWGEHQGQPFYTMDFVPGVPLSRLLADGPLPVERAVKYLLGMARAVAAAHALGIVHRDLKPGNVIIDSTDQPRVLDFGLAKRLQQAEVGPGPEGPTEVVPLSTLSSRLTPLPPAGPSHRTPVTERGVVLGTPAYMAPEQARGEREQVGPAADVYALGSIFFEMLTGRPPFQGEGMMETLMQVLDREPPPPRSLRKGIPATLEELCLRCLAKNPAKRYPDAGELTEDLEERWLRYRLQRRFARLALAGGAVVLLTAGLAGMVEAALPPDWQDRLLHDPALLADPAAGPVARPLLVLGVTGLLALLPRLAQLALLIWLAAWIWQTERPLVLVATVAGAAVAGGLMALLNFPPGFGVLLQLVVLVVVILTLARRYLTSQRAELEPATAEPGAYLHRLFAVGGDAADTPTRPVRSAAIALADLEPGKVLHDSDECLLRRARQKSLDRAVLLWQERRPTAEEAPSRGVVVRHPSVLALYAVCPGNDGTALITEPAAASPLAEVLERGPLAPAEAVDLTVRLADALQAFHDQGVCHGRLSPAWILVRGGQEPLLCPCGVPSQSRQDRLADVQALGRLLAEWLPPRPRSWGLQARAAVHQVCDAAAAGRYEQPADLARDLQRAARLDRLRWRQRVTDALMVLLLLLSPAVGLGLLLVSEPASPLTPALLGLLVPAAVLLGLSLGRALVQARRLRLRQGGPRPTSLLLRAAALLALPVAWGACCLIGHFAGAARGADWPRHWLGGTVVLLGYWLVGMMVAALLWFGEFLLTSLRRAD